MVSSHGVSPNPHGQPTLSLVVGLLQKGGSGRDFATLVRPENCRTHSMGDTLKAAPHAEALGASPTAVRILSGSNCRAVRDAAAVTWREGPIARSAERLRTHKALAQEESQCEPAQAIAPAGGIPGRDAVLERLAQATNEPEGYAARECQSGRRCREPRPPVLPVRTANEPTRLVADRMFMRSTTLKNG